MALGTRHVLSLYRHPKLIDLSTGKVVDVWSELQSGLQDGSIVWGLDGDAQPPPWPSTAHATGSRSSTATQ